jgi:hypothetical protein
MNKEDRAGRKKDSRKETPPLLEAMLFEGFQNILGDRFCIFSGSFFAVRHSRPGISHVFDDIFGGLYIIFLAVLFMKRFLGCDQIPSIHVTNSTMLFEKRLSGRGSRVSTSRKDH